LPLVGDGIAEDPQPLDLDLADVALSRPERRLACQTDSGRRTGRESVGNAGLLRMRSIARLFGSRDRQAVPLTNFGDFGEVGMFRRDFAIEVREHA
jgi:hypothetical protein